LTRRYPRKGRGLGATTLAAWRSGSVSRARATRAGIGLLPALLAIVATAPTGALAAAPPPANLAGSPSFGINASSEAGVTSASGEAAAPVEPSPGETPADESSASGEAAASGEPSPGEAAASVDSASLLTTACLPEFGSFGIGNWPPYCWHPYGPRSPFNFRIPANPRLSTQSTTIVDYIRGHHWLFDNDGSGNFVIGSDGSRPVYWSHSSDPLVKVICVGEHSCQPDMLLRIPKGAQPGSGSDAHMTVVDQTKGLEYDFWQASTPEHGQMTVSAGNSIPIGSGTGTGLGGYADASYLGLLGGMIRAPELVAGKIEHALTTTVQCARYRDVWPAPATGHSDRVCPYAGPGPHFANLLQLNMSDAAIAATGAPFWQQAVMKAMAHYGIYVTDTNGPNNTTMSLFKEGDQSFTSFGYAGKLRSFVKWAGGTTRVVGVPIPVSKLRVIAPCVPKGTC
jgi:hypothetical protein